MRLECFCFCLTPAFPSTQISSEKISNELIFTISKDENLGFAKFLVESTEWRKPCGK